VKLANNVAKLVNSQAIGCCILVTMDCMLVMMVNILVMLESTLGSWLYNLDSLVHMRGL
jgi:hypothetical protein